MTGTAGTTSTAGATGMAGTGGEPGTAGTTATAGTGGGTGTAGAGGAAGAGGVTGTAGVGAGGDTGGTGGTIAPVPTYCEAHPNLVHALPYTVAQDFKVIHILTNNNSAGFWKNVATADCSDTPVYTPFPTLPDGGTDAGDDGGTEGGVDASDDGGASEGGATSDGGDAAETSTLALDPDAGDGGVADAEADASVDAPIDAAVDAAVDAPANDASTTDASATDAGTDAAEAGVDAGPPLPACYEFSFDPDGCVGACWAGVVFEVTDVQGPSADTKGVCIAPGAMSVEFWARASRNNANVKFGSIGEGVGSTEFTKTLTTTWTRYTVSIPGTYSAGGYNTTAGDMQGVWNAFSAVVDQADYATQSPPVADTGPAYIEVKDIHWIAAAQ